MLLIIVGVGGRPAMTGRGGEDQTPPVVIVAGVPGLHEGAALVIVAVGRPVVLTVGPPVGVLAGMVAISPTGGN